MFLHVFLILRAVAQFLDCEVTFTFHMTYFAAFALSGILDLGPPSIGEILTHNNSRGAHLVHRLPYFAVSKDTAHGI